MNDIPNHRIDNCGFMIGTTGTCYYREKSAWKGMLILSAARGGLLNTYYGNLDLLSDEEAKWFGQVQKLFYPLQKENMYSFVGGIPGQEQVYGHQLVSEEGMVLTLVNPSNSYEEFKLPDGKEQQILFADDGFEPVISANKVILGPEQLVVIGTGKYASVEFDLGRGGCRTLWTSLLDLPSSPIHD